MVMIVWVLILLATLLLWFCFDDSIEVNELCIQTEKVDNQVKLAVLSDFHSGKSEKILDLLKEINPDVVLIPGDLIDENYSLESVKQLLKGIKNKTVFYVTGNHEYKTGRIVHHYHQLEEILDNNGVVQLVNESQIINVNGQKIQIGGIQDHRSNINEDPDKLDEMNIHLLCDGLKKELYQIVLMHRPEQYRMFEHASVDLLISGHAHGGQWRLPGINGLFAPQQGLFPKRAAGVYPLGKGIHLVSRGLAHYWFLPRLFNHREINVIVLQNKRAE